MAFVAKRTEDLGQAAEAADHIEIYRDRKQKAEANPRSAPASSFNLN